MIYIKFMLYFVNKYYDWYLLSKIIIIGEDA